MGFDCKMEGNGMTLWRLVQTKHLKNKTTPDPIKNGVGAGASLYEDLGSVIEYCHAHKNNKRKQWSVGKVECFEGDVERNPKSSHSSFKALHDIALAEPYVSWQQAKIIYQNYYSID